MSDPRTTIKVPTAGMRFAVQACFAAPAQGQDRRFDGVAYGGGVITDHGWWDAVAFDLAGLHAQAPMPVFLQHDPERAIGLIDAVDNSGSELRVSGRLFTSFDADAQGVAAKADAGLPWEMSVGIFPDSIEEVSPDALIALNGRTVKGRVHVFRKSRVRETSFVAMGADGSTSAHVFNTTNGDAERVVPLVTQLEATMPTVDELSAQLAQANARADAERAARETAEQQLAAFRADADKAERAAREESLKKIFGADYTEAKGAPYLAMTPEQFDAVRVDLAAARASKLPPGFTSEQVRGGAAAGASLTPEQINKFRRDNPGATYEQAFAALKAA